MFIFLASHLINTVFRRSRETLLHPKVCSLLRWVGAAASSPGAHTSVNHWRDVRLLPLTRACTLRHLPTEIFYVFARKKLWRKKNILYLKWRLVQKHLQVIQVHPWIKTHTVTSVGNKGAIGFRPPECRTFNHLFVSRV